MVVEDRTDAVADRTAASTGGRWELLRLGFAATYLLGGIAHFVLIARSPGIYESFADMALVGIYTDAWREFVLPNLAVVVPLVGLFELAVGVTLLWRGRAVRLAHIAGAIFQVGLVLSGPWGAINAGLALLHVGAARVPRPRSIPSHVRNRGRST